MKNTTLFTALIATAAIAATSASATEITVPDYTVTPDGSTTVFEQNTDIATPNGGNVLPAGGTSLAYFVTTFNFGIGSDVHIKAHFIASLNFFQDRVGVKVEDTGLITFVGSADASRTSVNLSQDMAGQSVTVLARLDYDVNRNGTTADDTLMNVWINPTAASVEGPLDRSAGDMSTIWNSANFPGFTHSIENQSTPGTAGDSSITDTVILTGTDATFAKALELALPPAAAPGTLIYGK